LSALLLVCSIVKAEVPDGVWTIAEPTGLEFTEMPTDGGDTHVYLYNPAAKMFFASGNDWNTRASIAAFGYEVWFVASTEADAPEGSLEFWDDCQHPDRVLGFKNMFTDDGGSTWVDHAEQANYSWAWTKSADGYRIQNVALIADVPDYDGKWIGWKGDYSDTRLYMLAEGEGAIDWKVVTYDSYQAFIASEAYEAYKNSVDCYSVALTLKTTLENAEALGANIADYLAVYKNTASTAAELKAANDAMQAIIDAREALKATIDDAKAAGFTETADAEAVLANGDATADQLNKANEALKDALVEWGKGNASVEHPADMSSKIVNPTFDKGDCTTGWSGDPFGRGGTVSDGAEHYSKNFDSYQTIKDLPAGVYAVGVNGYYRSGNYNGDAENHWLAKDAASKYVKLYGKVGDNYFENSIANVMDGAQAEAQNQGDIAVTYKDAEDNDVTVYVPNTMIVADYYFHTLHQYANKLYVVVGESDELTIGVKKENLISGDWSMFDDFSLTYYGAGSDAAKLFLDETMKNYSEMTIEDGTIYTESYLTAYNEALKQEISVSSLNEVASALAGIEAAKQAIDKNIALWKEWKEAVAKANTDYVLNDKYQGLAAMDDLADYCDDMNIEPILDELSLTNEELEAEIAKIAAMCEAVKEESLNAEHEDGDDMTQYIVNPGFDEDKDINSGEAEGWTIDKGTGGNIVRGPLGEGNQEVMKNALGYNNFCFEAWHRYNWDVWQEIENLPRGMYELNVQGYVRCEVSGYNRPDDILPDYPSPIFLYMNSATAQFPSVYSEPIAEEHFLADGSLPKVEDHSWTDPAGSTWPNSMGAASLCFGWDMYKMSAYGLIAKKGDKFRIGVRNESNQDWWCIWDNFKLTYRKPTAEIVQPILEAELEKLDLTQAMGSEVFDNVATTRKMAEDAIASGDGEQMFDALVQVYDASDAIRASVNKFKELETSLDAMAGKMAEAQVADIKAEAQALYDQINTGIADHTIATADIDGLKNDIAKMINRLGLPEGMENASDDNPVECTSVIINPSYIDGNDNGWTGGAAINGDAMDAEKFNTAFNYYQVLQGLPAGTYQVTVQGFYRAGFANEDYDAYIADPTASNNAFLYAIGEGQTYSTPLQRLASEPIAMETLADGYAWASEANQLAAPNSMTTAGDMFLTFNDATGKNYYANNVLTAKVGEDGVLTIGLKKDELIASDWTIWTNWQLFYHGTSSSLEPNDDPSGIKAVNGDLPVKVEFFNLNGARISKPQKGVAIMRQQMSDGSVKVSKVLMK
jgi:hypothetical protein